ncbi:MAG TPA: acetate--CoA ligase family protein [Solirubrobacterales bacterium]|jgi:acetate---CoA ligase (ADP-forming)|nr:acetate--CoA ligase family protein [Solirubrobacterales bacterium]
MDLSRLIRPRSVAVVGASDRPDSYAGNVLRNLERSGFEGPVWGVNPKRDRVLGRDCVTTVSELPEAVDAVVVAIPAPAVPGVIAEAGERGCGGAVVLSAGFGEIEAGRGLEAELRDAALAHELPVCGPNGNGIIAVGARAAMWGDSVAPLEPGGVALVSQSGNVAVNALGSLRGIGYHTVVSTGNQAVLDASDWLGALAVSDGVRSVAAFLEADGDGARLAEALARCCERGIGVAVLKVGASDAGARAASAHTGAVAGDQRIFRALVEEAGAACASDPHELLELARALAEPAARPSGEGALAILTCSGGDSGVAADQAQRLGVELGELAPATRERLGELLPAAATIGNPLDYTALIWGEEERLRNIVAAVGDDPAIDQLLLLYDHPHGLSAESAATWARVRAGLMAGAGDTAAAALVASTLPDLIDADANRELAAQGVPAIAGLRTALVCAQAVRRPRGDPARLRAIESAAASVARAASGGASPDGWLDEVEAKRLLTEGGVAVPRGAVVSGEDECVRVARELDWPVALKLSSPRLQHKSESGALALGLASEADVRSAHRRLADSAPAPDARMLVERMVEPGVELLVSARSDAVVPALVVGLGGIWTEALNDVTIVPLPADAARVEAALRSLRGAPLLTGGRGGQPLDLGAVAAAAARVGELLLEHGLELLELNPVVVHREGCVALDAVAHRG